MAEDTENSAKKHRVIHWNPDAGREQARKRWTWKRILAWSVGGFFALLIVAGIINRLPKLFGAPSLSDMIAAKPPATAVAAEAQDPNSAFITQAKAEQTNELVSKSLAELRRMPADHPRQIEQLVLLEKSFIEGQTLLARHEFGPAYTVLDGLKKDIDAFAQNVKAKGEAKQGYDKILLRIKDLEAARSLAPESLDLAFEAAGAGRQLLNDGNFTGAMREFQRGYAELKKAEAALAEHVRLSLVAGEKAIAQGQKEEAKKAFEAALEKSPGNEAALRGLKRAETIERVHALLIQGDRQEKEKQFAAAAESYAKAFSLDPLSAEAQQGQARAARLEKETKFAAAKSAAEEAVKRREWNIAIQEFQNALKVYPQKTEVQTALKSARENAHKDAVQKALAKGYAYENNHQWTEAREAYNETLQLDPENADAKERYKETGRIIRALLQYNSLVDSAEQLANKAEFQSALKTFNQAVSFKPDYLEYSDRVMQLRKLLQEQSKPVEVTFRSDGKTYVSIVNYKQPQQFESMTLKILPGDYEVVGRRKGYRDLRMMLQVRNGTPPPTVTVVCNVSADKL
jgi:tetratricopeptide (TPR) repeat protein